MVIEITRGCVRWLDSFEFLTSFGDKLIVDEEAGGLVVFATVG